MKKSLRSLRKENTIRKKQRKYHQFKMRFEKENKRNISRKLKRIWVSKQQRFRTYKIFKAKKKNYQMMKTMILKNSKSEFSQMMNNLKLHWYKRSLEIEKLKISYLHLQSNIINFNEKSKRLIKNRKKLKWKLTISHFQRKIKRNNLRWSRKKIFKMSHMYAFNLLKIQNQKQ